MHAFPLLDYKWLIVPRPFPDRDKITIVYRAQVLRGRNGGILKTRKGADISNNATTCTLLLRKGVIAMLVKTSMAELKHFTTPDEVRTFPKGKLELVKIGGATIGRATFEPGWRWSTSIQPLAKTKSCEAPHFQYHVSGTIMVVMDDGTRLECKAGDVSLLPTGHDAWVVGNEPAVVVDFQGMVDYAKETFGNK